jgi:hypothetical protein
VSLFLGLKVWGSLSVVSPSISFWGLFCSAMFPLFRVLLRVKSHSPRPPPRVSLLIRRDKHKCATTPSTKVVQPPLQPHLSCKLLRRLRCPLSRLVPSGSTSCGLSDRCICTNSLSRAHCEAASSWWDHVGRSSVSTLCWATVDGVSAILRIEMLLEIGWRHTVKVWSMRICTGWFGSWRVSEIGAAGVNNLRLMEPCRVCF